MKELQEELIRLIKEAKIYNGVLTPVYKKKIFSDQYLRDVVKGKCDIADTEDNKKKVKKIISLLEEGINEVKNIKVEL